jgi:hypothetical protein
MQAMINNVFFKKKKDLAMRDHFVFDTAEVRGSSF